MVRVRESALKIMYVDKEVASIVKGFVSVRIEGRIHAWIWMAWMGILDLLNSQRLTFRLARSVLSFRVLVPLTNPGGRTGLCVSVGYKGLFRTRPVPGLLTIQGSSFLDGHSTIRLLLED